MKNWKLNESNFYKGLGAMPWMKSVLYNTLTRLILKEIERGLKLWYSSRFYVFSTYIFWSRSYDPASLIKLTDKPYQTFVTSIKIHWFFNIIASQDKIQWKLGFNSYHKIRDCYVIVEYQTISVLMLGLYFHLKWTTKFTLKANSGISCHTYEYQPCRT